MADRFNPGGNDGGYSFGAALSTYTKKGNKWVFGGEYLLDVYKRQVREHERKILVAYEFRQPSPDSALAL